MRKTLIAAGLATALATVMALRTDGSALAQDRATAISALNGIKMEPVLNYDVSGSTLTGPFHSRITVYNNGFITSSNCGGFVSFAGSNNGAGTAMATPAQVSKLRKQLIDAGGLTLPDQNISVADLPLTTVTVFQGATNAKAHTFSFWAGFGAGYSQIQQVILDFAGEHPTSCP